jgi:hypothetical protein
MLYTINCNSYSWKPKEISAMPFDEVGTSAVLKRAHFSRVFTYSSNFLFNAFNDIVLVSKLRVSTTLNSFTLTYFNT